MIFHPQTDLYLNLDEGRYEYWRVTQEDTYEGFQHEQELVDQISFQCTIREMYNWLLKIYKVPPTKEIVQGVIALWDDIEMSLLVNQK